MSIFTTPFVPPSTLQFQAGSLIYSPPGSPLSASPETTALPAWIDAGDGVTQLQLLRLDGFLSASTAITLTSILPTGSALYANLRSITIVNRDFTNYIFWQPDTSSAAVGFFIPPGATLGPVPLSTIPTVPAGKSGWNPTLSLLSAWTPQGGTPAQKTNYTVYISACAT